METKTSKLERIANFLKKKNRYRLIPRINPETGASEKYLERFYLTSSKLLGQYLHRFWANDPDGLHDHPFNSLSIYLKGRYIETIAGYNDPFIRSADGWKFAKYQILLFSCSSIFLALSLHLYISASIYWLLMFFATLKVNKLIYFRPATEAHRITLFDEDEPGSTWTYFIRFKRTGRLWGFYPYWTPAKKQSRRDD